MSNLDVVLGGYANVKVNDVAQDVLILRSGLLLVDDPDRSGAHLKRLNRLLAEVPVEQLVRRHRLVRFADVTRSRVVKRTPLRVELDLAGGDRLTLVAGWTTPLLTPHTDKILFELLARAVESRPLSEPAAAQAGRAWSEQAVVLDAMANVHVDEDTYDLVVLDVGLVLIADPGPFEQGRVRLTRLVRSMPAYEIAGRHQLIRYESVVDGRITREIPLRAEIDLFGEAGAGLRLAISEPMTSQGLTDGSRQVLIDALRSVGAVTPG